MAKELDRHNPIRIQFDYILRESVPGFYITFSLQTVDGLRVLFSDCTESENNLFIPVKPGRYTALATVPPSLLAPGRYIVTAGIASTYYGQIDRQEIICAFDLFDVKSPRSKRPVLAVPVNWQIDQSRRNNLDESP